MSSRSFAKVHCDSLKCNLIKKSARGLFECEQLQELPKGAKLAPPGFRFNSLLRTQIGNKKYFNRNAMSLASWCT